MKPEDYLQLSLKLLQSEKNPAGRRSAVSRAYYAAFHKVSEFVRGMDVVIKEGPGAHGDVPHRLVRTGDQDIDQVGLDLAHLHSERVAADYRLNDARIEKEAVAHELVNLASDLIVNINRCKSDKRRYATVKASVLRQAPKQ